MIFEIKTSNIYVIFYATFIKMCVNKIIKIINKILGTKKKLFIYFRNKKLKFFLQQVVYILYLQGTFPENLRYLSKKKSVKSKLKLFQNSKNKIKLYKKLNTITTIYCFKAKLIISFYNYT